MTTTRTIARRAPWRLPLAAATTLATVLMLIEPGVGSAVGAPTTGHPPLPVRDGRIVFKDYTANQIFTVNPDGTALQQVTHASADQFIGDPAWSPDGKLIIFDAALTGQERVWVMNADGSHQHQVTTDPSGWRDVNPQFTPAGSQIVYQRCHPDPPGDCAIAIVHSDGSDRRAVTHFAGPAQSRTDRNPSVSPNGEWIAYERWGQGGFAVRTWISRLDGSNARPVTPPALEAGAPEWGLDSRHLLVTSLQPHYGAGLFLVDTTTLDVHALDVPPFPHNDVEGNYAPRGDRILFLSDRGIPNDRGGNLWLMNPDGSDVREIPIPSLNNIFHPDWGVAPLK
jgi:Tol biopolymer transport system component